MTIYTENTPNIYKSEEWMNFNKMAVLDIRVQNKLLQELQKAWL